MCQRIHAAVAVLLCLVLCGCRDRIGLFADGESEAAVAVFGKEESVLSLETEPPDEEIVYITPTGGVYHTVSTCRALQAANGILTVTRGEAALRGITKACRYCG